MPSIESAAAPAALENITISPTSEYKTISDVSQSLSSATPPELSEFLNTVEISGDNDDASFHDELAALFTTLSEDYGVLSINNLHIRPPPPAPSPPTSTANADVNETLLAALYDPFSLRPRFADILNFSYRATGAKAATLAKVVPAVEELRIWWVAADVAELVEELVGVLDLGGLIMLRRLELVLVGDGEEAKTVQKGLEEKVGRLMGREKLVVEVGQVMDGF